MRTLLRLEARAVEASLCADAPFLRLRGQGRTEEELGMEHLRPGFGGQGRPAHFMERPLEESCRRDARAACFPTLGVLFPLSGLGPK